MGLALRERPPMMLVDGDTLDQERKPCREADKQAPIFHTLGLCLLRGHGHVKHVVHSQLGLSSVYRQPSLNATLRPADLSQVEYEVIISLLRLTDAHTPTYVILVCSDSWTCVR